MRNKAKFAVFWAVLGAASAVAFGARAQVGTEGRISTRSDVRMSIEGAPGTGGKKLDALAKHLGTPLGEVKRCYAEVVKEHPDVVGTLGVELELKEGAKGVTVRVPDAVGKLKPMDRCIDKAFGKLGFEDVPRPAAAKVILELTNSAAHSVDEVRAREEAASRVEMTQQPDGSYESSGVSTQGEVSFRVKAKDKALVEAVHQKVRDALPGMFDCRRRASKLASPEGDIVYQAKLRPDGVDLTVTSSSVANERAPTCTGNALKPWLKKAGRGVAQISVHFTHVAPHAPVN
jgi:hypothetical protein